MERTSRNARRVGDATLALLLAFLLAMPWSNLVLAQSDEAPTFKPEELEQIVAPIALYPDSLLAQVFMASTYPLEIVEAARWAKSHPGLEGDKLADALEGQSWDPSVKSIVAFPDVLTMMNDKLDWTQKLGDAFLAQQSDVMQAVQVLRNKAKAAGNLETTPQQQVIVEQPPASEQGATTIIKIEPASPEVVYVPTYNPTVVYGTWPYAAYPPYSYYPPGYVAATSILSFGVGLAVGSALWGNCNWGWGHGYGGYGGYGGHNNVNVNVNNYNNFNRTNIQNNNWQHNSAHRKGVQYRDRTTQDRFGKGGRPGADSREAFRGRAEQGRQQMARDGGAGARRDLNKAGGAGNRPGAGAANRPGGDAGNRGGAGVANRAGAGDRGGAANRASAGNRAGAGAGNRASAGNRGGGNRAKSPGAFSGQGSGKQVRHESNRGNASRQSAARGGHGGSRGGGGGMRSGGGGGGRSHGGGGGGRGGGGGGRGGGGGGRGR